MVFVTWGFSLRRSWSSLLCYFSAAGTTPSPLLSELRVPGEAWRTPGMRLALALSSPLPPHSTPGRRCCFVIYSTSAITVSVEESHMKTQLNTCFLLFV